MTWNETGMGSKSGLHGVKSWDMTGLIKVFFSPSLFLFLLLFWCLMFVSGSIFWLLNFLALIFIYNHSLGMFFVHLYDICYLLWGSFIKRNGTYLGALIFWLIYFPWALAEVGCSGWAPSLNSHRWLFFPQISSAYFKLTCLRALMAVCCALHRPPFLRLLNSNIYILVDEKNYEHHLRAICSSLAKKLKCVLWFFSSLFLGMLTW